jgi:hypothetical protein
VGLVYDPRELPGVTTVRPGVAGVLQATYQMGQRARRNLGDDARRTQDGLCHLRRPNMGQDVLNGQHYLVVKRRE